MRSAVLAAALLAAGEAQAGRPLITDDAGVVGEHTLQIETWLRLDRDAGLHVAGFGYGPLEPLEVSVSIAHGIGLEDSGYTAAGPTLQLKVLAFEPVPAGRPGMALATGVAAPFGFGNIEPDGWSAYDYLAITEVPASTEWFTVHANIGAIVGGVGNGRYISPSFGLAGHAHVIGELDAFAEIVSGNPATEELDGVAHAGLKYALLPNLHVDATVGGGIWGQSLVPPFVTVGSRWANE